MLSLQSFGTALHFAIRCNKPKCVQILLQFNADIYAVNKVRNLRSTLIVII